MSKNKHMLPCRPIEVAPTIATSGPVCLVQGVYGARGNLELVACDPTDGLWVFWFNAGLDNDPPATPEVPPGHWSAGLRFAQGARYLDAQILQSALGPDHLEVLALADDGALHSWYWSPGPGFRRRVTDAAGGVARFSAAHDAGALRVTVADEAGAEHHLESTPQGYPDRAWHWAEDGPALDIDATAEVVAAGIDPACIQPGTARRASSSRAGGTTELTWRDAGGGIRHLGIPSR